MGVFASFCTLLCFCDLIRYILKLFVFDLCLLFVINAALPLHLCRLRPPTPSPLVCPDTGFYLRDLKTAGSEIQGKLLALGVKSL